MTVPTFKHSPLDPSNPRAIQVLELLPSRNLKGPICCKLRHRSLDDDLQYEALSYTWGDAQPGHTVFVNGPHTLDVTPNCLEALKCLRRRFHRRFLWVDAICIDQRNNDTSKAERDRQVKIMGDIYHNAQNVLIWLGPAEHDTARTMDKIKLISRMETARAFVGPGSRALFAMEKYLTKRMFEGKLFIFVPSKRYQALHTIICSSWWQRVWTLQEQVLARQCTAYHGRENIPMSSLQAFQLLATGAVEYLTDGAANHDARDYIHNFVRLCDFQDGPENPKPSQLCLTKDLVAKTLLDMAFLLEAKRPVDRVYGLYSILTAYCDLPLSDPDYKKTAEDVYEETVWSWVNSRADLSILKLAARPNVVQKLPSWVPAWHQQHPRFIRNISQGFTPEQIGDLRNSHFNWHQHRNSATSGPLAEVFSNTKDNISVATRPSYGKLCILGARFAGKVSHAIGADRSNGFEWYLTSVEGLYMHLDWCRLIRNVMFHSTSEGKETLHEMFRSIRLPGVYMFDPGDLEERKEIFESFQAWFDFISCLNDASESPTTTCAATHDADNARELAVNLYYDVALADEEEESTDVLESCYSCDGQGRKAMTKLTQQIRSITTTLFTMRNHRLCILDNDNMLAVTDYWCQEGDEVFVFPGTDSPFVLRKQLEGDCYRLVGPALVDRLLRVGYQNWRSEGDNLQNIVLI